MTWWSWWQHYKYRPGIIIIIIIIIPGSDVSVARYLEVNAEYGLADDDVGV